MASRRMEAVIFDMDGVLVNSEQHYVRIEKQNFEALGLPISEEEHHGYQGSATDEMWKAIKLKHGVEIPLEELVELTNSKVIPFFESLEAFETMPGVEELIKYFMSKTVPIAIASSADPEIIEIIMRKTGLGQYFNIRINSSMVGKSKPAPDIFLLAAKQLNIKPENCLVIEDSTNGIKAAKDAGMYCIAFNGPGAEHQNQSQADMIVTDYGQIIEEIEKKEKLVLVN